MIKLLSALGAIGMSASLASSVVACGNQIKNEEPAGSSVDENGILTSEFKMLLKKESIFFGPLDTFGLQDKDFIQIKGLALIDSDKDSLLQNGLEIYREIPSTFKVKFKDIKNNLANTRDKLSKDLKIKVYLTSNVTKLQNPDNSKLVVINVANNYDGKINGKTLPILVQLPKLKVIPKPKPTPKPTPDPTPVPKPINPVPDVPKPVNPSPVIPNPVPDKPDHYVPGNDPCAKNNDDVGLLNAEMSESGTIIDVQLTKPAKVRINKNQIVVTDGQGNRISVYNTLSDVGESEVDIILDSPVAKGTKLYVCILGIANQDGLVNVIPVDMNNCKYVPAGWVQWESIWSLTKKTIYYGAEFSWYAFKLSVRAAFLLCPCSWPCEIVTTCFDITWVPKYLLDVGMYV